MAIVVPIVSQFNNKGVRKAIASFKQAEGAAAKMGVVMRTAALPAAAALGGLAIAGAAVGTVLLGWARNAEQARRVQAKLNSVLDQMGVGEAAQRVSAYAEQLEKTLGIDADVIKRTQTKLATFSKLTKTVGKTGGAFDRATKAALDLAAAGFGEAETNAVQLGKALQDPIKGISALARAGVSFTDDEKKKIRALVESNRLLEAQDVILRAIEGQVGGTAEANVSSFDKINLAVERVKDQVGDALLPAIERMVPYLEDFADAAEAVGEAFGEGGLRGAIQQLKTELNMGNFWDTSAGEFFKNAYNAAKIAHDAVVDYINILTTVSGMQLVDWLNKKFFGARDLIPTYKRMPSFEDRFSTPVPVQGPYLPGQRPTASRLPQGGIVINVQGGDPQAVVDALRRYSRQNGGISGVRLS
jgi:hypothetical protein